MQILDAADVVARRDGLDNLTIRALCAQLGVTAPAVYRHFASKDLIVEEVVDRIIARTELPGPDGGDWAARLRTCYVSVHDEVQPYAGLAARMGHEMPGGPAAKRNGDYLDTLLRGAGIGQSDAGRIVYAVFVYVWGHLLAADSAKHIRGQVLDDTASRHQFLWGLDHLLESFRREFGQRRAVRRPRRPSTDPRPTRAAPARSPGSD
jgi:AcrR family transcriptional regulator